MRDHEVAFDSSATPPVPRFPPLFNAVVPFVERHAHEGRADRIAVSSSAGDVTYRALGENVNRCANLLNRLGIARGERLVMIVKDSAKFFYLFWGAIKCGVIPVPANTLWRGRGYQYIFEDSACRAVVYSAEFSGEVEAALEASSHKPAHALVVEGPGGGLRELLAGESPVLDAVCPTSASDDCFWVYSSGSTGSPKGVVHHHAAMVAISHYFGAGTLGIKEDDICFSAAKLFFSYGLGNGLIFPLWCGARSVLLDGRPTAQTVFAAIEKFRPTIFFGVPTLFAILLQEMEKTAPDISSLRLCISAGEALPAKLFQRWQERTGLTILDGIGSTELLNTFISNTPENFKPGTSGRPVPGFEAKIVNEDHREVSAGETGLLMVRGISQLKHYWNKPKKTADTVINGWVRTGDRYYQDEDGFFVPCGRQDDMLKVGGIWCSPIEIERRLSEHPAVSEAAVGGRADADDLIKPEAFIVLNKGNAASQSLAEELLQFCKSGLARYKYPRWFNFVEQLPRTPTGKLQRFRLAEMRGVKN